MTVTPFDTSTGGERYTVLSRLSFFDFVGHASLTGRSSTWYRDDQGFASSGMLMARLTWSVGDPKMIREPSARVYSWGSFRFAV